MNFTKIKQYSLKELFVIAFYKIVYLIFLKIEKTFNKGKYAKKVNLDFSNRIHPFSEFFDKTIEIDRENIINEVNEILDGNITILGKEVYFNYEKDWLKDPCGDNFWDNKVFFSEAKTVEDGLSDVKYVLELNKLNHLVRVAVAYYHTNDIKYIEYIENSIRGFIKCVPYQRSVVNRIIMDLSFRAINLIQISLLCWKSDIFKSKTFPLIISLLNSYELQMRKFSTPRWFKTGNGVNHNIGEMVGLIITQLWLSQFQEKVYKKNIKTEFKYLHEVLDRTIAPSGVYLEQSANYARVVIEFLIIFEIFLKELIPNQRETTNYLSKRYKERLISYLNDLYFGDKLPNFGDNDNARVLWAFIEDLSDYSYLGLLNQNTATNNSLIITKYIDGSQWIFKSQDKNNVWIFTRVGKFAYLNEGAAIHTHNDLLAILLSINNKEVFIDRGTSFYNSGVKYLTLDKSISSHNTVYIEKRELSDILGFGYKNYPLSKIIDESDSIFSGLINYKDIIHKRKIQYINNSIFIIDNIFSENIYSKGRLNFLIAEDIVIKKISDKTFYLFDSMDKISLKLKFEGVCSINILETEYYPQYGERRITKSIQCLFDYKKQKKIITQIELS